MEPRLLCLYSSTKPRFIMNGTERSLCDLERWHVCLSSCLACGAVDTGSLLAYPASWAWAAMSSNPYDMRRILFRYVPSNCRVHNWKGTM